MIRLEPPFSRTEKIIAALGILLGLIGGYVVDIELASA